MGILDIKFNGNELSKRIRQKGEIFERKKQSIFNMYSLLLETKIKEVTPKRTSTLVRYIHQKKFKDGFRIYTNLSYSKFVENGTRKFRGRKFFERTYLKYKDKISDKIQDEIRNIL